MGDEIIQTFIYEVKNGETTYHKIQVLLAEVKHFLQSLKGFAQSKTNNYQTQRASLFDAATHSFEFFGIEFYRIYRISRILFLVILKSVEYCF